MGKSLYQAEVKNVFGNVTILENKLVDCTATFTNLKFQVHSVWVKPTLGNKTTRFLIGINFTKYKNGCIIVQGKMDTICKQMNSIHTIPLIKYNENIIEEILPREITSYIEELEDISLEIEDNLTNRRLEHIIKKLKDDGTIGEILLGSSP